MLCDDCGKREATVRFEQVIGGKRTVTNLCQECAQKRGIMNVFPTFNITSLMSALMGSQVASQAVAAGPEVRCPICGMSYKDFSRAGMLGCSHCYETFEDRLEPLLRRIHGSDRHVGKVPPKASGPAKTRKEIEDLKHELSAAITKEQYEKAAELRDRIHQVEDRLKGEEK